MVSVFGVQSVISRRHLLSFCRAQTLPRCQIFGRAPLRTTESTSLCNGRRWMFRLTSPGTVGSLSWCNGGRLLSRVAGGRGGIEGTSNGVDCGQDGVVDIFKCTDAIGVFIGRSVFEQRTPPGHQNNDSVNSSWPTKSNGIRRLDLLPPIHGFDTKGFSFKAIVLLVSVTVFEKGANDSRPGLGRKSFRSL